MNGTKEAFITIGETLPQSKKHIALQVVEGARPLSMNHFKVDLTKALVRDGLLSIIETQKRRLL